MGKSKYGKNAACVLLRWVLMLVDGWKIEVINMDSRFMHF